ncbi:MAG: hypothetical protein E2P02_17735 [Acidobacteria bacterium]|nr:MAG: hypothetical protein E2P02_17735 [Acidobacteriota bacterium]
MWLDRAVVLIYVLAALGSGVTVVSGKLAENTMTGRLDAAVSELVAVHGEWAFGSVLGLFLTACLRFDLSWRDRAESFPRPNGRRYAALAIAFITVFVLLQTAGRGGELVYRYGVGVETSNGRVVQ